MPGDFSKGVPREHVIIEPAVRKGSEDGLFGPFQGLLSSFWSDRFSSVQGIVAGSEKRIFPLRISQRVRKAALLQEFMGSKAGGHAPIAGLPGQFEFHRFHHGGCTPKGFGLLALAQP